MVEVTKVKSVRDITSRGYKDLGIFEENSMGLNELIMKSVLKRNIDLTLLYLDEGIYQVFIKKEVEYNVEENT